MEQLTSKNRKRLKNKMAETFNDHIRTLSPGMQEILLDDLITAFENRFKILNQTELNMYTLTNVGVKFPDATIQT